MKTTLNPSVLKWARQRAGLNEEDLAQKIGLSNQSRVQEWERTGEIEFGKLERVAQATHTPIGYLFLPQPPQERLPINDFRRLGSGPVPPITPDLLDVIYAAQRRQEWYREYLIENGAAPLQFVGALTISMNVESSAERMVSYFNIGPRLSIQAATWRENLAFHLDAVEESGVLVMRSGVVGNSNNRKLSVDDFRGFALADSYAPVVFINSTDSIAAQIFTLIHELVHICLGESAVSNLNNTYAGSQEIETFCNAVAAELLMPKSQVVARWNNADDPIFQIRRMATNYKVSTLVAARRVHDAGFITKEQFNSFFKSEVDRLKPRQGSGGNIYNSINSRVGGRIVSAIIASTMEGKTVYREAMRLLGIKSSKVIDSLAKKLGYSS
jgi:Zn-dependent peptidase ImmA (M78 family)